MTLNVLALLAVVIILVLGAYAAWLLWQVRVQEKQRREQQRLLAKEREAQRQRLNHSIQIIARALLEEQVSLTEGAIRIKMLMEALEVTEVEREEFTAFYQLADATAHIPILQDWKKLSPKEQRRYTFERLRLEADHKDFVLAAAERIQGRGFQTLWHSA